MKKLSIAQIVLGIITIFISCYIIGWMIFGAESLLTTPFTENGTTGLRPVVPEHEAFFTAARYASALPVVFGIIVLITDTVQTVKEDLLSLKLPILQITSGALIAISSIFISIWGYPLSFESTVSENSNLVEHILINPGPEIVYAILLTTFLFLPGIAILGCGIVQLLKAIKVKREMNV